MSKVSRVRKNDWLEKALQVLEAEGIVGVRVERLARELGVAKSGFYWHFQDREDLYREMLDFWSEEFTESVVDDPLMRNGDAETRLRRAMELIEENHLARYDLAIRGWAERSPEAMRVVRRVYRRRASFVSGLFEELGFQGDELTMRVETFVCYHSWQQTITAKRSKTQRSEHRERRLQMLISR